MPDLGQAGNVLRPRTALKISLRLPPTLDATALDRQLRDLFQNDPPYGAHVSFEPEKGGGGWEAPKVEPWLEQSIDSASKTYFGKPATTWGEGGSIPFMGMLGLRFPQAQFLITGVLGPHSNAHGPNEFLDLATARNLTACVAQVLADEHTSLHRH
jgi:acetylornithine deacetylase/succinyl-diaminopimelate desuccinylase-like protein